MVERPVRRLNAFASSSGHLDGFSDSAIRGVDEVASWRVDVLAGWWDCGMAGGQVRHFNSGGGVVLNVHGARQRGPQKAGRRGGEHPNQRTSERNRGLEAGLV